MEAALAAELLASTGAAGAALDERGQGGAGAGLWALATKAVASHGPLLKGP